MDSVMELAMEVGALKQRLEQAENKIKDLEGLYCGVKELSWPDEPEKSDKQTADKLLQDGIDAIMSYRGPQHKVKMDE